MTRPPSRQRRDAAARARRGGRRGAARGRARRGRRRRPRAALPRRAPGLRRRRRTAARWRFPAPASAGRAAGEPRRAAVDADHALVQRRQHRQKRAFARPDVDGKRPRRQQRRDHRQEGKKRRSLDDHRTFRRGLEKPPAPVLPLCHHALHPRQRAAPRRERTSFAQRRGDHRVGDLRGLQQGPRSILPREEEARVAKRLSFLGDLGLALVQKRRQLADGQFLLCAEGEQAQAVLVGEEAEEVRAGESRRVSYLSGHAGTICHIAHICNFRLLPGCVADRSEKQQLQACRGKAYVSAFSPLAGSGKPM